MKQVLLLLVLAVSSLPAQTPRKVEILVLDQPWRFHLGDDLRWKEPGFDDSNWGTLLPTRRWTAQGVTTDPSRYAWYRLRVPIQSAAPLTLRFPEIHSAVEVFVDGRLVMSHGVLGNVFRTYPMGFPPLAPLPPLAPGSVALVAVRVWLCQDDRTREISTRPAQEIAEAAKQWGQNDDITVVTVRRQG